MRKLTYLYLAAIALLSFSCDKTEDGDLITPKATGTLNGNTLEFTTILSDVISNNGVETAYIVMRKDFEGYNKPATNGQQLLIRIEPFNGPGTYSVNANSFWVFEDEITISGSNITSTLHRFSSDESSGLMKVIITEDAVKQGKRTLVGSFEGKNGISIKNTGTANQSLPLKSMEFKSVTFTAPDGEL